MSLLFISHRIALIKEEQDDKDESKRRIITE
jgi:hypothetical protein